MIFLGATLVSTSGRERGTLTTSRELPARKHAGRTHHLCPKESEHTVLLSVPHKEAHLFLTAYCRFLSVILDQYCTYIENLTIHNEERARGHAITWGNRRWAQAMRMRSERGVCHNLGMGGRENLQYIGSCIHTWDDEFVQTFRGKTSSIKPVLLFLCLASLLPIVVFLGAW